MNSFPIRNNPRRVTGQIPRNTKPNSSMTGIANHISAVKRTSIIRVPVEWITRIRTCQGSPHEFYRSGTDFDVYAALGVQFEEDWTRKTQCHFRKEALRHAWCRDGFQAPASKLVKASQERPRLYGFPGLQKGRRSRSACCTCYFFCPHRVRVIFNGHLVTRDSERAF